MSNHKAGKILSIILAVIGILMMVFGIAIYAVTSSQLKNQHITVADYDESADAKSPNGWDAGKDIAGPFTALAQIKAITHHMSDNICSSNPSLKPTDSACKSTITLSYGQLPSLSVSNGKWGSSGSYVDPIDGKTVNYTKGATVDQASQNYYSARSTQQSGSLLIASLYVSVLAFGVATLIIGLGLVVLLVSLVLIGLTGKKKNHKDDGDYEEDEEEGSDEPLFPAAA